MKKVKSKDIQIDNSSTFQEAEIMHTLCAQFNWSHMVTDIEFSEL